MPTVIIKRRPPPYFPSFHVRPVKRQPYGSSRVSLRANRSCGMVAVTSRLGVFLGDSIHENTSLPCPTRHALTLRCVDLAPLTVHLMFSAVSHQDLRAFRRQKSTILPCILEAFHGAM